MPYDKEQRKAYNKAWRDERKRGDPDYMKKEADRLFNDYWKDPEKKRQQNRLAYYRARGRQPPTQFKPYKFRDPSTRPEPVKFLHTPPTPLPQISQTLPDPPISFNIRDLFS